MASVVEIQAETRGFEHGLAHPLQADIPGSHAADCFGGEQTTALDEVCERNVSPGARGDEGAVATIGEQSLLNGGSFVLGEFGVKPETGRGTAAHERDPETGFTDGLSSGEEVFFGEMAKRRLERGGIFLRGGQWKGLKQHDDVVDLPEARRQGFGC